MNANRKVVWALLALATTAAIPHPAAAQAVDTAIRPRRCADCTTAPSGSATTPPANKQVAPEPSPMPAAEPSAAQTEPAPANRAVQAGPTAPYGQAVPQPAYSPRVSGLYADLIRSGMAEPVWHNAGYGAYAYAGWGGYGQWGGAWNPTWGGRQIRRFQGEEQLAAVYLKGSNDFLRHVRVYVNGCVAGQGNDFNNPRGMNGQGLFNRNDRPIPLAPNQVNQVTLVTRIDGRTVGVTHEVNPSAMAVLEVASNGGWNSFNVPASKGDFFEADGAPRLFDENSLKGRCRPDSTP